MNGADKALGRLKRPINEMPHDVALNLKERRLSECYQARPAYQRNDYLWWIGSAKRESTRVKRIEQMTRELEAGDSYMGMPYLGK